MAVVGGRAAASMPFAADMAEVRSLCPDHPEEDIHLGRSRGPCRGCSCHCVVTGKTLVSGVELLEPKALAGWPVASGRILAFRAKGGPGKVGNTASKEEKLTLGSGPLELPKLTLRLWPWLGGLPPLAGG